jgi:hypothetical protein
MGDGRPPAARDNRQAATTATEEERPMLEWRPRLIAVLALVILVALSLGFGFPVAENWEW